MLELAGFDVGDVDTKFDAKTAAALAKFEQAASVAGPDGVFDGASFTKLEAVQKRIRGAARARSSSEPARPTVASPPRSGSCPARL